jgi:hypothetical protein
MKKQKLDSAETKKEQMIQDALRTGGFLFPQTVAEVEKFEKNFGTTQVPLPEHLKVPPFLKKAKSSKVIHAAVNNRNKENFAVAAREGAPKLPEDILQKMEDDRKKEDDKRKKGKTKKK